MTSAKLQEEIASFQTLWEGGFRCGYSQERNQKGVETFVKTNLCSPHSTWLEIGCGGGQWSKAIYPRVAKLYAVDILSATYNKFWEYVGGDATDKIEYLHVKDFNLSGVPDNSIDFVFSYDVFCHISLSGQKEYMKSLKRVMKPGAIAFIMYADIEKYVMNGGSNLNTIIDEYRVTPHDMDKFVSTIVRESDGPSWPGRWYFVGIENFVKITEDAGFTIIQRDIDIDKITPITMFANWKK